MVPDPNNTALLISIITTVSGTLLMMLLIATCYRRVAAYERLLNASNPEETAAYNTYAIWRLVCRKLALSVLALFASALLVPLFMGETNKVPVGMRLVSASGLFFVSAVFGHFRNKEIKALNRKRYPWQKNKPE